MCGLRGRETPGKEDMEPELFRKIVTEGLAANPELEVGLFYIGESTMNPGLLVECLKIAKKAGCGYVFLTTNGSLMAPMLAGELMAEGIDSIKWSINATAEQFRETMGVKPALLEKALRHLKAAREIRDEAGYKTRIYASSIRFDGEQQEPAGRLRSAENLVAD